MKKLLCLMAFIALFLGGCGTPAQQSEFWKHPTVYKNWDHLKFSTAGYENPEPDVAEKSKEQGWWGIPVEVDASK